MTFPDPAICPDARLSAALTIVQADDVEGIREVGRLLTAFPNDARLHFLYGSVLAGVQRYDEGRAAMQRAVELAPDYDLARFQLGFLEFTSGLAAAAAATWTPLVEAPDPSIFAHFASGLNALARDDFSEAERLLEEGMRANDEHPLINGDMQLLLDEVRARAPSDPLVEDGAETAQSATHQLLQQFEIKDSVNRTRH